MSNDGWTNATQALPPAGLMFGPHPPCDLCGSDGFPADLEITVGTREAHLCIDCYVKSMPAAVLEARPADRAEVLALREQPYSRSWRGWPRAERQAPAGIPGLVLP